MANFRISAEDPMPSIGRFNVLASLLCVWLATVGSVSRAQSPPPPSDSGTAAETSQESEPEIAPLPDLTIPAGATVPQLQDLLVQAKGAKPRSADQYKTMQTAIRDISKRLLAQLQGKEGTPDYQQAEMDTITSSVALMTYFNEKQQTEVVQQVHDFLKAREELSMQDVQTGMMAAAMLELQPNKKPSRDTYELMDKLLEDDPREEMQSLRLNLQAVIRRLNLLGNKFEFEAVALDGKKVSVDDYAGKFVVVDFFATWCEPCLAEVPRLQKHFEKYHTKGLEVIGISLDGEEDSLQKFLEDTKLPWPIIHDNAENPLDRIQMKFGVSALPTVLLLNKEGTVVSLEARGAELDRLMQMLFEAPTPAADPAEGKDEASSAGNSAPPPKDSIKEN